MSNDEKITDARSCVPLEMEILGRANYEGYCATLEWKSSDGTPLPQWEALDSTTRIAWGVGALAVKIRVRPDAPERVAAPPSEGLTEPVHQPPRRVSQGADARNRTDDRRRRLDPEDDAHLPMADWRRYDPTAVDQIRVLVESALDRLKHASLDLQNAFDALFDLMTGEDSVETESDAAEIQVLLDKAESELPGIVLMLRKALRSRDDPEGVVVRRPEIYPYGDGFPATAIRSGMLRLRRPGDEPEGGDRA